MDVYSTVADGRLMCTYTFTYIIKNIEICIITLVLQTFDKEHNIPQIKPKGERKKTA